MKKKIPMNPKVYIPILLGLLIGILLIFFGLKDRNDLADAKDLKAVYLAIKLHSEDLKMKNAAPTVELEDIWQSLPSETQGRLIRSRITYFPSAIEAKEQVPVLIYHGKREVQVIYNDGSMRVNR